MSTKCPLLTVPRKCTGRLRRGRNRRGIHTENLSGTGAGEPGTNNWRGSVVSRPGRPNHWLGEGGAGWGRDSIPGRLAPAGHRRLSGQPISAGFTTAVIDEPRLAARDPRSHWLPAGHASWAGIRPPVNQSLYPATVGKPAALHLTLAPPTGRVLVNRSPPICLLLSLSLPPCA